MTFRPGRTKAVFLIVAVLAGWSSASAAELLSTSYWLTAGQPGKITWVEIHNGEEARTSGIVHLEILARKKSAPVWEIEHVCSHLAITTAALQRSVTRPYKTRSVYPESYFTGYELWKAEERKGTAVVCSTSIQDFLQQR